MKLLFVTDQLPYPPRNGVTIPLFHFIRGLVKDHEVYLIWTPRDDEEVAPKQMEANQYLVEQLWIVPRRKKSVMQRIQAELRRHEFGFNGWLYEDHEFSRTLYNLELDAVWISPVTVIDVLAPLSKNIKGNPIMIAGLNDCTTVFMRNNARRIFLSGTSLKRRLLCAFGWMRSWPMAFTETNILNRFDLILVQTATDKHWLEHISAKRLSHKIVVISNGVDSNLFTIPIRPQNDILYIANLEALYGDVAFWLLVKVWPYIRTLHPKSRFVIIGKGASERLKARMAVDPRVIHHEFVKNLSDVFAEKGVSITNSFKCYGLINKVIESMAAGVPVVGDRGSFNGITGFKNGCHGLIAEGKQQTVEAINRLLSSSETSRNMAESARAIVKAQFNWGDRIQSITETIRRMQRSRN